MKANKLTTIWLFTAAIFLAQLLPWLVKNGMFLDGLTYSAISRNLAFGSGSAWRPHYTQTFQAEFYGHPPLVFIIQSIFFRILGDGLYTERIFSFLTALLSAFAMYKLWRLFEKDKYEKYGWIAIITWISVPVIAWSFRNNMLENVVCVFTLFSVYFLLKAASTNKWFYTIIGSLLLLAAFFSKGPVGLFPLITPLGYWAFMDRKNILKYAIQFFAVISICVAGFLILFYLFPESKQNLTNYFDLQLIPALNNEIEIKTNNRFSILGKLILSIIFPLVIAMIILINERYFTTKKIAISTGPLLLFLFIALSASLPLIITLKQSRAYLVPSIPFYAIALSYIIQPAIKKILDKISFLQIRILKMLTLIAFVWTIFYTGISINKYDRDEILIQDIYKLEEIIPPGTIISSKYECDNWILVAYLSRYANISLDCTLTHDYFLLPIDQSLELANYERIDTRLQLFDLYQRKKYVDQ